MTNPEEMEEMMDEFSPNLIDADLKNKLIERETKKLQMPLFPTRHDLIGPEWDWDVDDDTNNDP